MITVPSFVGAGFTFCFGVIGTVKEKILQQNGLSLIKYDVENTGSVISLNSKLIYEC